MVQLLLEHALERIARATRSLREATRAPERCLASERALAAVLDPDEVDRLGWCMGVLAAARGTDLLRERRERDGLARFVAFVGDALGAAPIAPAAARLPRLSSSAGAGWEVPLAAGWLFFAVARARPGAPLGWCFETDEGRARLALATRSFSAQERRALVCAGGELGVLPPDARWESVGEDVGFALPRHWFES